MTPVTGSEQEWAIELSPAATAQLERMAAKIASTPQPAGSEAAAIWAALTEAEQRLLAEFLRAKIIIPMHMSGYMFSDYETLYDLRLIVISGNSTSFDTTLYKLTDLGRAVLAASAPAPVAAVAESAGDEVALHRAEIARLRVVLTAIRDYPIVESDMEAYHQVAGMAMQAEVALEVDPPKSGLLTILSKRNEELKAELATLREKLATVEAEAGRLRAAAVQGFVDVLNSEYSDTPTKDMMTVAHANLAHFGYQALEHEGSDESHFDGEWVAEALATVAKGE